MEIYTTELGYQVTETINGLDVTENGDFVCELTGKSLSNYRYTDDNDESYIDNDKLEADIEEQVEVEEFIENQHGYL